MSDDRATDDRSADERTTGGQSAEESPAPTRRATVTTTHADAATARRVAASLRPDNTAEMATSTESSRVVTVIGRDDTGGLASTLDDYVVNATVAARLTTETDDSRRTDTATRHSDPETEHSDTTHHE